MYFFLFRTPHDGYIYLYRISYMYYIVLGFSVTFIVGMIVSSIFCRTNREYNPDLFTPFVANRLKRREKDIEQIQHNVSFRNNCIYMHNYFHNQYIYF